MVPPLNTSWTWLQAYSAPWIPGSWGKCTQLTDEAKPRKRPLRQDRLLLLHTTGQILHTGALKEAGFFLGCFCKRDSIGLPAQLTTDEEATGDALALRAPGSLCSLGCHTWNGTRKLATYLSRPPRSPDFLQRPLTPTLAHVDTSTQADF